MGGAFRVKNRTISEQIKQLEDLRDKGLLSHDDFSQKVRDLLETFSERQSKENPTQPDSPPMPPLLRWQAPPEDDDNPDISPFMQTDSIRSADYRRVIITGKTPWDDGQYEKYSPFADDSGRAEKQARDPKKDDAAELKREHLAKLASDTLRKIRRKKRPDVAFILSLLCGGLGHIYIGSIGIGSVLLSICATCYVILFFGEMQILYFLPPLNLLSAALAHKQCISHNADVDRKTAPSRRRNGGTREMNLDRSIRTTEQLRHESRR